MSDQCLVAVVRKWEEVGPTMASPLVQMPLEDSDPRARLLTQLTVRTDTGREVNLHLEAIAVHLENEGTDEESQVANRMEYEDLLEHAYAISGDGPFTTLEIGGRDYVLIAVAYAA